MAENRSPHLAFMAPTRVGARRTGRGFKRGNSQQAQLTVIGLDAEQTRQREVGRVDTSAGYAASGKPGQSS
jgi:hypothetical protein